MPFGFVFAVLYYGLLCAGLGLAAVLEPGRRLAGACLALLGVSLAIALLRRLGWARWTGALFATVLAILTFPGASDGAGVLALVLLLASVATAALLAWPATGRPTEPRRGAASLRIAASAGAVGFVISTLWLASDRGADARGDVKTELPAAARASRSTGTARGSVAWKDYTAGLARARELECPVVATFVTDWCPYCTKMSRETWRAPEVVERLSSLVAVRVDAEGTSGAPTGAELASRYGIQGLPSNFILSADGSILSRRDGFLTARQLLDWLDSTVGSAGFSRAATPSAR